MNSLINWSSQVIQEAALSLYQHSTLAANPLYQPLIDELLAAGWLTPTSDSAQSYQLNKAGKAGLKDLLELKVTHWQSQLKSLANKPSQLETFTQRWGFLQQQLRLNLPTRLNAASLSLSLLGNQEAYLAEEFLTQLPKIETSQDLCLHFRGDLTLNLHFRKGTGLNLEVLASLSELVISQRDLDQLSELEGELPSLILSVEDRGTFLDMDLPANQLAMWVNKENLSLAASFLRQLPQYVPHIHFGNLDHQGLVLAELLAQASQRPVKRFIPEFWNDYVDDFAQPVNPEQLEGQGAAWQGPVLSAPLLNHLMTNQLWLAQAPLIFDARLYDELKKLG